MKISKVALVEDDPQIQQMYKLKLEEEGFVVQTANNGNTGVDLAKEFRPDLVLLDVMMPESGGVDFLSVVRRDPSFDQMKVLVMTNLDDEQLRRSMAEFRVNGYVVKADTTPSQIVERIRSLE